MASLTHASPAHPRVVYVDWLRILAVLLLIPYHSARLFYIFEPFYVESSEKSVALSAFIVFLVSWHMPLLFFLAGAATWFALGFRTPIRYVVERCERLIVPLVVGVLIVVPPQMFFARMYHERYSGAYLDFYPSFFQTPAGVTSDFPGIGFSLAHLWFILFLFVMSLIALPLFVILRGNLGVRLIDRVATHLRGPGAILLLALPLPFTDLAEDPMGHNFLLYIILFGYGYLLASNGKLLESAYRGRWIATALGVVATTVYFVAALVFDVPTGEVTLPDIIFVFSFYSAAWFWIVALLGFGQRYLNATNAVLRYANEAAYPFYILHQTVIVVIGYYVVQWSGPAWTKFVVIALGSLVACVAIYDVLVRRTRITRFLFGMKVNARREVRERTLAKGRAVG